VSDNFISDNKDNYIGYKNNNVDALFTQANKNIYNSDKLLEIANDLDSEITKDYITLKLYEHPNEAAFFSKKIKNVIPSKNTLVWNYWDWTIIQ
jgi:ABC-type oligopeptide transport system substrate-binding subunit